ncbi:ead/Ea22-like family protein [Pseudomonas aeruginosa]
MDTNKLKELAEKLAPAYQRPWESHRHSASAVTVGAVDEDGEYCDFIDVRISDYSAFDEHDDELGQWVAAANPKTVLALLDEIDRLRQGMKGDYDIDAWLDWSKEKERIKAENDALRGALQAVVDDPTWRSNDNTLWPKIIKAMDKGAKQ